MPKYDDDEVSIALRLISENYSFKETRDVKNEAIRKLFKEGFECSNPSGTRKIGSKVIQQCMWRVMSKVKFLDFQLQSSSRSEEAEAITTDGFRTVIDRGGLDSAFRDKGGVFFNSMFYGDAFLLMGKNERKNDQIPLNFRVLENEDVYGDNFCKGIRGVRPAQQLVVLYSFSEEEAYRMFPELKENKVFGRIPGSYQVEERDDERQESQTLEIAYAYNLNTTCYTIFAGSQTYILDQFKDKEYPFMKKKEPFIPVFQFLCIPSEQGFTNYGIGDMVYDLAVITRRLLNLQVGHTEENVHPLTLINAPNGKIDELVEKMAMAYKAREAGKKPFVAMEFDPNGGAQSVGAQALVTQNLVNEWKLVWETLYREIARMGIYLDDVDRGSGITRGQVIAEEEASNAFVTQMMEYNASETQDMVECILEGMKEYIKNSNKSPIDMVAKINDEKLKAPITLGMISKELKEGNYFVTVNSRTGSIPSDLMRMTQMQNQLQLTQPGSPEYNVLYKRLAIARGIDLPAPPPPPAPEAPLPGQGETNAPGSPGTPAAPEAAAGTQRQTVSSATPGQPVPL